MSDVRTFEDWHNPLPNLCDICGKRIIDVFIDGKTFGPWAILCPKCFERHGTGLGPGKGQMYIKVLEENECKRKFGVEVITGDSLDLICKECGLRLGLHSGTKCLTKEEILYKGRDYDSSVKDANNEGGNEDES